MYSINCGNYDKQITMKSNTNDSIIPKFICIVLIRTLIHNSKLCITPSGLNILP